MEAQLCNLADEIAYNAHDIDDGVRSGLITLEQLQEVPLFEQYRAATMSAYPGLKGRRILYETIRRMLSAQVYDVIETTAEALAASRPGNADEVRAAGPLVHFSPAMREQSVALKTFLHANLYRHEQVTRTMNQARQVVADLFAAYRDDPDQMRADFSDRHLRSRGFEAAQARVVSDYIAGMTDRFALHEHERLTGQKLLA